MNVNTAQRWGGAALILVGGTILFASLFLWGRGLVALGVAVLLLVAGAVLVGWSRRGPPV